jgi:glycosyltransferase involved in cell wall biosynthesis
MIEDPALVTVVIPVRDMEATIGAQLAALAAQDYDGAWELLVADNGSRDGTVDAAGQWSERLPLHILDASASAGVSHARNAAAAVARGQLLLFCDADDEVRPEWMRMMVCGLRQNPLVSGVYDHVKLNSARMARLYPSWPTFEGHPFLPSAPGGSLGIRRSVFDPSSAAEADFCPRAAVKSLLSAISMVRGRENA